MSINPHALDSKDMMPGSYIFLSIGTGLALGIYFLFATITITYIKDILTLLIQIESIACPIFFAVVIFIVTNDKILERQQDLTLTRTSRTIILMIRRSILGYLSSLFWCLIQFVYVTGFVSIVQPYGGFRLLLIATSIICMYPFWTTFAIAYIILDKIDR